MKDNLTETLMHQFHQCANLLHRSHMSGMRRHDGEFAHRGQGRLLALLLERDGISHKDIVEALDIRPSSESELVARLEQSGYVQRSASETDRRMTNVHLTDEGREAAKAFSETKRDEENAVFGALNEEEQTQLSSLLGKLIASLKEMDAPEEDGPRRRHGHGRGDERGGGRGREHGFEHGRPDDRRHHGRQGFRNDHWRA